MKTKWMLYKELELIPNSVPEPQAAQPQLASWLGNIWQSLVSALTTRANEPQIWQSLDYTGQLWCRVHDPVTGQTACLESETEVCIGLDQLPYR